MRKLLPATAALFLALLCAAPARAQVTVQVPAALTVAEGDGFAWHTFASLGAPVVAPQAGTQPYGIAYSLTATNGQWPNGFATGAAVYPGGNYPIDSWFGFPVMGNTVRDGDKTYLLVWFSPTGWPGFNATGVTFTSQVTVVTVLDDD
jgi:hypothetical protein